MKSTSGTIATIRNMEVCSLYNSQSDPQCLELVTGACASVASCLNTIGHNVACFTSLLAGEFTGSPVAMRMVCGSANLLAKSVFATFGNSATGGHDTRRAIMVGFVDVQPGFLQLLQTQTWVKCTSLDSSRCVVYYGIRLKVIRAASKKLEQNER